MSSEDTMDAVTAGEADDVAQDAPSTSSEAEDAPPPATASEAQNAAPAVRLVRRQEGDDPIGGRRGREMRARWFNDMRGWIMVVAVQVASSTYQAGLNPPGGFSGDGTPMLMSTSQNRYYYYMFVYFNTTAFVTSLAIILLLMNPSFYHSEAKVVALETIVVLDVVGLMRAYWAGTTSAHMDHTTKYTLGLTALVLFVVYVVYMVQLLRELWRLAAVIAASRRARAVRVRTGDTAPGA